VTQSGEKYGNQGKTNVLIFGTKRDENGNPVLTATSANYVRPDGEGSTLSGRKSTEEDDDDDDDDDEDDDDDDDDDFEIRDKKLAAQTLLAIQWLCNRTRLTKAEKRVLSADIISKVSTTRYSRTEVAFSLFIGDGRPGETALSVTSDFDFALVEAEDMKEFEEVCHVTAKRLLLRSSRSQGQ